MRTITRLCLSPLMKAWLMSQQASSRYVPRPRDEPRTSAPGPDPDRVLVLGSGPAVGWGMVSHDIALPGSLARALSVRTGRGARVDVIAEMRLRVDNAVRTITELDLTGYAAIVLTLGARDALTMVSVQSWRADLVRVLDALAASTSPDAVLIVAGILPLQSVPGFNTRLGLLAASHAGAINAATVDLCSGRPGTTYLPLSAAQPAPAPAERDGRTYRLWATEIAGALGAELDRIREERSAENNRADDADRSRSVGHRSWTTPSG